MYFVEFESYEQSLASAKMFTLEVVDSADKKICSSDMPIALYQTMLGYIEICEEAKAAIHVWNHQTKYVTMVPYHAIRSVRLILL